MQTQKTIGHLPKDILCYIGALRPQRSLFRVAYVSRFHLSEDTITVGVYSTLPKAMRALDKLRIWAEHPYIQEFEVDSELGHIGRASTFYSVRGARLYKWDGTREVELDWPAENLPI